MTVAGPTGCVRSKMYLCEGEFQRKARLIGSREMFFQLILIGDNLM
jgi:hypothetical protein